MDEFRSRSRHVGSVLCVLTSSGPANPRLQGEGFYGFRDAADALSLTRGLTEKERQLLTSGAVKDGESASSLWRCPCSGLWEKPQVLFQALERGGLFHQKFVSDNLGPNKLSCHFKTIL